MLTHGIRHTKRAFYRFRNSLPRISTRYSYKPEIRWWHDRQWMEPYQRYLDRDGRSGTRKLDRRFTLLQFAQSVRQLPGSTAECGVGKGGGSALICRELQGTYQGDACHFAFDSFEGFPAPTEADRMKNGRHRWFEGKLRHDVQTVSAVLAEFPFCQIEKGWIPDSLRVAESHQFRFLHVDVDLHQSTKDSLEFFYQRMVDGGVIVFDDHGFIDCLGARQAAADFFADKPEPIVELTTGQAFVIVRRSHGNDGVAFSRVDSRWAHEWH